MGRRKGIPVIDLFAGPGGLGEGFSSVLGKRNESVFDIRLSIEKDQFAFHTLRLRSFFRKLRRDGQDRSYYDMLQSTAAGSPQDWQALYERHPQQAGEARDETWQIELGKDTAGIVFEQISERLGASANCVLIGGPPCQAYSIAGRSRNKGIVGYRAETDARQTLYVEYLQVLADHEPAIFVMENVRGIISAQLNNEHIFQRILEDLEFPAAAIRREGRVIRSRSVSGRSARYKIYSLVQRRMLGDAGIPDYLVRMEQYGIPQARHRIILFGVRDDLGGAVPGVLRVSDPVAVDRVLRGLPRLRSGLSRDTDSVDSWLRALRQTLGIRGLPKEIRKGVDKAIQEASDRKDELHRGAEYLPTNGVEPVGIRPDWFVDPKLRGILSHSTRSHMASDLERYLFAAVFTNTYGRSPRIVDFPSELIPQHRNVMGVTSGHIFSDRFRVQMMSRPATTITSHIGKDGHYFIHYDPAQCRSLTVREAARVQTFPDNYSFQGPRTEQYSQVGNAVPPLLAAQIAEIALDTLVDAGLMP